MDVMKNPLRRRRRCLRGDRRQGDSKADVEPRGPGSVARGLSGAGHCGAALHQVLENRRRTNAKATAHMAVAIKVI